MRRLSLGLVWICALAIGATGCAGGGDDSTLSVEDVESAFARAGEALVRQKSGPFRVGNREQHGCEEVRAKDFRISVTVCRGQVPGPLLMRFIPTMPVHQFGSTEELLTYLRSGEYTKGVSALLIVRRGNLTITYVGGDAARVEIVETALAHLSD
jgi:hypothetical protein